MAKILFVNRSFWPDTEATGLLLTELTEDLACEHEVTVICGPANTLSSRWWPLLRHESHGAVKIVRTCGPLISKRNLMLRMANLCIYFGLAAVAAFCERADLVIAETDPPVLGALGAILKRVIGCRFVYYCQDLFPDIAKATGGLKFRPLLSMLGRGNNFAYRRADAIVVLAADMAERLQRKGVAADRIVVIPNWVDCRKVMPQASPPASRNPDRGDFVVMYAGNIGWPQNLESVLETARLMHGDHRVRFMFVGDGSRKLSLQREARRKRLLNVEFIDRCHPNRMSEVLAEGDLHLIPLTAGAAGSLVPSKVYWTLAAGKPYVAMMEAESEVARLAIENKVGFVVAPGDAAALARTITESMGNHKLLDEMGLRARALAEQSYDRRFMTRRFADFLVAVLAGHGSNAGIDPIGPAPATEINIGAATMAK